MDKDSTILRLLLWNESRDSLLYKISAFALLFIVLISPVALNPWFQPGEELKLPNGEKAVLDQEKATLVVRTRTKVSRETLSSALQERFGRPVVLTATEDPLTLRIDPGIFGASHE